MSRRAQGNRTPTIPDVAALAGVSSATAARALGGYGSVSATARAKVTAAAEDLGYRVNGVARSMITGRTMTFGVVVGDIENDFFSRVVRGFSDVARVAGFATIVASTDERLDNERSAVRVFSERRVDGLLVAPASMVDGRHLREARDAGAAVVLIDRKIHRVGLDTVLIDSVTAARSAVEHLTVQGHERIGLITGVGAGEGPPGGEAAVSTSADRLAGYREALEAAGLSYDPTLVRPGDFHLDAARSRAADLLSSPERPTAVFATDGVLTLGALLAIRDVGLRCPEDVSLVGFDDPAWASVVRPRVSVMAQPVHELGAVAARRLLARVAGDASRVRAPVKLSATWVPRDSVAAPSQAVGARGTRDQRRVGADS
ncbi:MAG TPA: LacI family DNA-binding transcriptional regulator [Nocardioidaceae bacterium]|nr:LacI family DNA-binding transcriptional regulator [Nocardioidaceae bacterium]